MSRHTLSVLVENKPGVLVRVAGLFARRGFNIHSLAVGPTERADLSRMTLVVDAAELPLEQITKQLNKLINVIKIVELDPQQTVGRELLLVKIKATASTRTAVLELANMFHAKILDVSPETVTVQVTGNNEKLVTFLTMVRPYGVRELVQSGVVAMARGTKSINDRTGKSGADSPAA